MYIPSKKVVNEYGKFDSEEEWLCFKQKILPMSEAGYIDCLERQVSFEIIPKLTIKVPVALKTKIKVVERVLERAAEYTCDFFYHDKRDDTTHIVEFKSRYSSTARDYPLRRKLIKRLICEWNEKEGRTKYVFDEYKDTDLVKEKKVRTKKTKSYGKKRKS